MTEKRSYYELKKIILNFLNSPIFNNFQFVAVITPKIILKSSIFHYLGKITMLVGRGVHSWSDY